MHRQIIYTYSSHKFSFNLDWGLYLTENITPKINKDVKFLLNLAITVVVQNRYKTRRTMYEHDIFHNVCTIQDCVLYDEFWYKWWAWFLVFPHHTWMF